MQLSLFQPDPPRPRLLKEDTRIMMRSILELHIPEKSIEFIIEWLIDNKVQLRISNHRITKIGDYKPPKPGFPARISVNHNLNKYSFLITLVHEMAHHMVLGGWRIRRPKPHGSEWQAHYRKLMAPILNADILPPDVIVLMKQYLENPKASTTADLKLLRILKKYDNPDGSEIIETLPFNAVFYLPNGLSFYKKEKIRKRYRCICINNGRIYLFNPMAKVFLSG